MWPESRCFLRRCDILGHQRRGGEEQLRAAASQKAVYMQWRRGRRRRRATRFRIFSTLVLIGSWRPSDPQRKYAAPLRLREPALTHALLDGRASLNGPRCPLILQIIVRRALRLNAQERRLLSNDSRVGLVVHLSPALLLNQDRKSGTRWNPCILTVLRNHRLIFSLFLDTLSQRCNDDSVLTQCRHAGLNPNHSSWSAGASALRSATSLRDEASRLACLGPPRHHTPPSSGRQRRQGLTLRAGNCLTQLQSARW